MPIRILHLSDILVGSSEFSQEEDNFVAHIKSIPFDNQREKFHVDYIVICGNITADGQKQSFDKAVEILYQLAKSLLPNEMQAPFWNRFVLVPGRKDLNQDQSKILNSENFINFYNSLCKRLEGNNSQFITNLNDPLVRVLKDLTIISFNYWNLNQENDYDWKSNRIEQFEKALNNFSSEIINSDYCNRTPTLLITSESPVLEPSIRSQLQRELLCSLLENKLKLDLHLFGAAPITCFPVEPFVFKHIGLATGPRANGKLWPLRANLITFYLDEELEHSRCNALSSEESVDKGFFHVHSFQFTRPGRGWDRADTIQGNLDLLISQDKRQPSLDSVSPQPYLQNLQRLLQTKRVILVEGMPGSFFYEPFETGQTIEIGNTCFSIIDKTIYEEIAYDFNAENEESAINFENEESGKAIKNFLHICFNQAKQTIDTNKETNKYLFIIHDRAFSQINCSSQLEWIYQIQKLLFDLIRFENSVDLYVLYVVAPAKAPKMLQSCFSDQILKLEDLHSNSIKKFTKKYVNKIPVTNDIFFRLTGIYSGFANYLCQLFQEDFSHWSGAEMIDDSSYIKLISHLKCIDDSRLLTPFIELSKEFYKSIIHISGGAEVYNYIEQIVMKSLDSIIKGERKLVDDIVINLEDIKSFDKTDIKSALNFLSKFKILEVQFSNDQSSSNQYKVKVIAPFLRKTLITTKNKSPLQNNISQERPIKIYISSSKKEQDENFKNKLIEQFQVSCRTWIKTEMLIIWDDQQITPGRDIVQETLRQLMSSTIILFLISSDLLILEEKRNEIKQAMAQHSQKESMVIPINYRLVDYEPEDLFPGVDLFLPAQDRDEKTFSDFDNQDEAVFYIVKRIKTIIKEQFVNYNNY